MPESTIMYTFINEEFLPAEKAFLHVTDLSIQRGYGIFDFLKLVNGKTPFIEDYITRFFNSANLLSLTVPYTRNQLKQVILELLQRNGMTNAGVKLLLTGGYSPDGYSISKPNLIITQHELLEVPQKIIEEGVKIITHNFRREMPAAKSINYITGICLEQKVREAGAYDVLYQLNGEISEFPRSNIFIVTNSGDVITPAAHVLEGITRKQVLLMNGEVRIKTGTVKMVDLLQAREAFITSTTKRVLPIVAVDGHIIGDGKPGTTTMMLLDKLRKSEMLDL